MIKVTTELQNTVRANRHIEKIYFDVKGDFFLNPHKHDGKLYHGVRKQVVTDRSKPNARPETIAEAKAEHELTDVLTREEVLSAKAENDVPLTSEAQAKFDALEKQLKDAQEQLAKVSKKDSKEEAKSKKAEKEGAK